MKKHLLKKILAPCLTACAILATPAMSVAQHPANPTNLKADILGTKVDLSWTRSVEGTTILSTGFEEAAFPGEGWLHIPTNTTDYKCSWFRYPTDECKENLSDWQGLIKSGEASAVIMWDSGYHEGAPYIQDEWLITPTVPNAAYLDFYMFINASALIDYGQHEEFPDHYYVKLSNDGGKTWEILWDARFDAAPIDEWQQVSIPLGKTGENTKIAFEAIGDQNLEHDQSLYFTWAIDDVVVSTSEAASQVARKEMAAKKRSDVSKLVSHREFTPTNDKKTVRPAKAPQRVAPAGWYNLYLDNELLAGYINTLEYTDLTDKDPGEHTYKVTYYDALNDTETEGTELKVTIKEMPFNPPTNLQVKWEFDDETQTYSTMVSWEAPEGDREPAFYNVYRDGAQIAYEYKEFAYGQTYMPKGVFVYQVSAHYKYPTGDSEIVSDVVAIDMRYPAMNLVATPEGNDVLLTWDAPKAEEGFTLANYEVYRGNTCLSSTLTETSYTDKSVAGGVYEYSVIAVYTNGEKALKRSVSVEVGTVEALKLPYSESFDGGMTPDNWTIINESIRENYAWRFDNFYELPTTGGGFSNEFASVNTLKTGFTLISSKLCSPMLDTKLEEGQSLFVEFDLDYRSRGSKNSELQVSSNGKTNWVSVAVLPSYAEEDLAKDETCKPQHVKYDLTDYVHSEALSIGWFYYCSYDGYISIDNVKIYVEGSGSVNDIVTNKVVESVNYFDLQGRKVVNPENGLYIKTTKYSDGSVRNSKVTIK